MLLDVLTVVGFRWMIKSLRKEGQGIFNALVKSP
jgi:hypothetical protein